MKMKDLISQYEEVVVATIDEAWNSGCPIAGHAGVLAPVAVRRWQSFHRRLGDKPDFDAKVQDLAKGIIAAQESDPSLIGPLKKDYLFLAERIAIALDKIESE